MMWVNRLPVRLAPRWSASTGAAGGMVRPCAKKEKARRQKPGSRFLARERWRERPARAPGRPLRATQQYAEVHRADIVHGSPSSLSRGFACFRLLLARHHDQGPPFGPPGCELRQEFMPSTSMWPMPSGDQSIGCHLLPFGIHGQGHDVGEPLGRRFDSVASLRNRLSTDQGCFNFPDPVWRPWNPKSLFAFTCSNTPEIKGATSADLPARR